MDILKQAPALGVEAAAAVARELFGVEGVATPLPSERDQNFLIAPVASLAASRHKGRTAIREKPRCHVLKIANASDDRGLLEAQNAAMALVAAQTSPCQEVVPATDGQTVATLPARFGPPHFVRLVTWLPGVTFGSIAHHPPALLRDLGRRLAEVDRALLTFDHPAIHRDFYWDLANALRIVRERSGRITDPELRRLVTTVADDVERRDAPAFASLRRSAIHNDANDHNVVVDDEGGLFERRQRVRGFVDFGDVVHSFTIADLAIAITYAILDKPDPLGAAATIAGGYHEIHPLSEVEVGVLFGLVCLRLCASASIAADQQRQRPSDNYLTISQAPLRRTLPRLAAVPRKLADAVLRHACGFPAVASSGRVRSALRAESRFAPVVGGADAPARAVVLDLSVGSPLVSGDARENDAAPLQERILQATGGGAELAVGRYGEARVLYTSGLFASDAGPEGERRTVHLGMDLFAPAGSPVCAPLASTVHAYADNAAPQDYGPVIVLRHETDDGVAFFTLYGHLSRTSIAKVSVGQAIQRGEPFAEIGDPPENGGWPPHLHFQVMADLFGFDCDFPGVCRAGEWPFWSEVCPDPNLIVRVPAEAFPPPERSKAATLAGRRARLGGNLSLAYRDPVKVVRGWMQYLFDETGRRYIDAYNNVPHVGHCHPRVVRAAADQMRVLNTNTRYLHDSLAEYAERLTATLPDPLRVCYFVNSGSEANELALRLARAHTRRRDVIVLEGAYHGNTTTLVAISPYKFNGPGGEGAPDWVHVVPLPDVYRGPIKGDDPAAGLKYAAFVERAIARVESTGGAIGAFIAESAPSVGGQIVLPAGYLDAVYREVRRAGGVCIADEVQTAFGRLGTGFYAFEAQQVVPDIVVMGKPIGNGHPIGAVVTTPEVARSFDNGMEFFSTFGGNTVSCAVGLAVLDIVRSERLQDHAHVTGERLLAALRELGREQQLIGDVRGSGLFLGVELVTDRETLEPATEAAAYLVNRFREEGVLLGTEGPFANVLKIRPPMPFGDADADRLVSIFRRVLPEAVI